MLGMADAISPNCRGKFRQLLMATCTHTAARVGRHSRCLLHQQRRRRRVTASWLVANRIVRPCPATDEECTALSEPVVRAQMELAPAAAFDRRTAKHRFATHASHHGLVHACTFRVRVQHYLGQHHLERRASLAPRWMSQLFSAKRASTPAPEPARLPRGQRAGTDCGVNKASPKHKCVPREDGFGYPARRSRVASFKPRPARHPPTRASGRTCLGNHASEATLQ